MAATGRVRRVIGTVVDIEFPSGELPELFNAVNVDMNGQRLVTEVQQHLGSNWVRCLALDSTDGLRRGATARRCSARHRRSRPMGPRPPRPIQGPPTYLLRRQDTQTPQREGRLPQLSRHRRHNGAERVAAERYERAVTGEVRRAGSSSWRSARRHLCHSGTCRGSGPTTRVLHRRSRASTRPPMPRLGSSRRC